MKTAIIGAGISGLSTGYFLKSKGAQVAIFEASSRVGGYAGTNLSNGFKVEMGPSSLLDNEPAFQKLIDDLGLRDQVIYSKQSAKNRFVFIKNQLHKVPMSPPALLKTNLLTASGKLRVFKDLFISPSKISEEETIYDFFSRHFGQQIAENLIYPAIVGVYAGSAKKLSLKMAFPKMADLDSRFGSLIKGLVKNSKGKQKARLFTFINGTQDLVDALQNNLSENLHLATTIDSITKTPEGWALSFNQQTELFDNVILCTGLPVAQKLLAGVCDNLPKLNPSDIAPVISLSLAFNERVSLDGYGVLIHPDHQMQTLGILFPADTFEGRCPADTSVLTFIMGGVFHPEALSLSNVELIETALSDLNKILAKPVSRPIQNWIHKHPSGITQYNLASVKALDTIKSSIESHKGLFLNSHGYGGVSLNDCIRKSLELSHRLGYN